LELGRVQFKQMFYSIITVLVRAHFPVHSASGSYSPSQNYLQNQCVDQWRLVHQIHHQVTLISDCVQNLLCGKSLSHFKFLMILLHIIVYQTLLTCEIQGELHICSHQRLHCYTTLNNFYQKKQKMYGKQELFYNFPCYIVYNELTHLT